MGKRSLLCERPQELFTYHIQGVLLLILVGLKHVNSKFIEVKFIQLLFTDKIILHDEGYNM